MDDARRGAAAATLDAAVGAYQHPPRLGAHAELSPQLAIFIGDLRDVTQLVLGDEVPVGILGVAAGDADEDQIVAVLCLQRCDRRRFTIARRSPRCPEPQQHIVSGRRSQVELLPVEQRAFQQQDLGA